MVGMQLGSNDPWESIRMQLNARRALCIAGLGLMVIAPVASAQQPPTVRIRGTIEMVDGNVLTLKSREGTEAKLALAENALIVAVVKASLAEIKEGTFLGSAAVPQADGSQ